MSIIDDIFVQAVLKKARVVLPESDPRILKAAEIVYSKGIAVPILLGEATALKQLADQHDIDIRGIEQLSLAAISQSEPVRRLLKSRKKYQSLSELEITQALADPITAACALLATGEVDACVAGAVNSTRTVLQNGLRIIGMAENENLLSSFMLMVFDENNRQEHTLDFALFADCAINISPDSHQLAQIAASTASNAERLFGLDPKLAMLSFSSMGSAEHAEVDKVLEATNLLRTGSPDLKVIGEVQFDAALLPNIRAKKIPNMAFVEPCNIFIFPDLSAGNIGYKIAERIGGAIAIGPILQGLRKPLNDLSRGADANSIVQTIALTCLQVQ